MRRTTLIASLVVLLVVACSPQGGDDVGPGTEPQGLPSWLGEVYPEPGAVVVAPDGVEIHHVLTDPSHDVRLIIDDVDVTTYASFDAERMRYESGAGPVVLEPGEHTAEAQLVVLPPAGTDPEVLETFSWQFRVD